MTQPQNKKRFFEAWNLGFGTFTRAKSGGFTLVEMVVTVAIFAIISSIVIARNASFDNEVLLNNLAYDIALSIRQAQQFGINVRVSGGEFDAPYGVNFEADSENYVLFADRDGDNTYGGAESGELLEMYTIGRGALVKSLCDLESDTCVKQLNIVFHRPEPDAIINNGEIARAQVEIISRRQQGIRYVIIESTGQIAIDRPDEAEAGFDEGGGVESEGR